MHGEYLGSQSRLASCPQGAPMIAGAGFAMAAWREALRNAGLDPDYCATNYVPQAMTDRCRDIACEHCAYYNAIDSATALWNARNKP
jgi:hypothetical protein